VARVAYADPRRLFDADGKPIPLHELPEEVAATIASYEVSPNGRDEGEILAQGRGPGPGHAPYWPVLARPQTAPAERRPAG